MSADLMKEPFLVCRNRYRGAPLRWATYKLRSNRVFRAETHESGLLSKILGGSPKWGTSVVTLMSTQSSSSLFWVRSAWIPRKKNVWDWDLSHRKYIWSWSLELIFGGLVVLVNTSKLCNMSSKLQLQICFWWYGYWSQTGLFFEEFLQNPGWPYSEQRAVI